MTSPKTPADALLPCPFCKSADVSMSYSASLRSPEPAHRFVECEACAAMGPSFQIDGHEHMAQEQAIAAWNRRALVGRNSGPPSADALLRTPAQFFFEVGYGACWADGFVHNGNKPPFPMTDEQIERAWSIAGEAYPDPAEFDAMLAAANQAPPPGEDQAAEGGYVRGAVYVDEECWTAEIQNVGGYEVAAEVYAGTRDDASTLCDTVLRALNGAHPATPEKAAERGDLREILSEIVKQTTVGKRGSCVTRSKYGSYPAALFHRAVAALAQPAALSSGAVDTSLDTPDAALSNPPADVAGWQWVPVEPLEGLARLYVQNVKEKGGSDRVKWDGEWHGGPLATAYIQTVKEVSELARRILAASPANLETGAGKAEGGLREVLLGVRDWLKSAPLESGYCCCGSKVEDHGFGDGHAPVDELSYSAMGQIKLIDEALASPSAPLGAASQRDQQPDALGAGKGSSVDA